MDVRKASIEAVDRLPTNLRRLITSDAAALVRTAVSIKKNDGINDGTIPEVLRRHDILSRSEESQRAYREMLINVLLFSDEAVRIRRQRRKGVAL